VGSFAEWREMKSIISEASKGWLRNFLAIEIMGGYKDDLNWRDQDWFACIQTEYWKPDEDWEYFGWMLDILPSEDWFLHVFIAEGGGWICEASYGDGEGVANDPSFQLAMCVAIAKAAGWGEEGRWER